MEVFPRDCLYIEYRCPAASLIFHPGSSGRCWPCHWPFRVDRECERVWWLPPRGLPKSQPHLMENLKSAFYAPD